MTPLQIRYSTAARRDLADLWGLYVDVSESLAERILHRIILKIQEVARHPQFGRVRPDIGELGIRSTAIKPHVIFYAVENDAIVVLRIVDGRRNLAALFGGLGADE